MLRAGRRAGAVLERAATKDEQPWSPALGAVLDDARRPGVRPAEPPAHRHLAPGVRAHRAVRAARAARGATGGSVLGRALPAADRRRGAGLRRCRPDERAAAGRRSSEALRAATPADGLELGFRTEVDVTRAELTSSSTGCTIGRSPRPSRRRAAASCSAQPGLAVATSVRLGVQDRARLALAQLAGGPRLQQVVGAGRAAAEAGVRDLDQLDARQRPQQPPRLLAHALAVQQVAGVLVDDPERPAGAGAGGGAGSSSSSSVTSRTRAAKSRAGVGAEQLAVLLHGRAAAGRGHHHPVVAGQRRDRGTGAAAGPAPRGRRAGAARRSSPGRRGTDTSQPRAASAAAAAALTRPK